MIVTVQSKLNKAEEEITSLKRKAGPEELTPEAKHACVDEVVQKLLQHQFVSIFLLLKNNHWLFVMHFRAKYGAIQT